MPRPRKRACRLSIKASDNSRIASLSSSVCRTHCGRSCRAVIMSCCRLSGSSRRRPGYGTLNSRRTGSASVTPRATSTRTIASSLVPRWTTGPLGSWRNSPVCGGCAVTVEAGFQLLPWKGRVGSACLSRRETPKNGANSNHSGKRSLGDILILVSTIFRRLTAR